MQLPSTPSKAGAIQEAIADHIAWNRKRQLLDLRGRLDIIENWQELRNWASQERIGEQGDHRQLGMGRFFSPSDAPLGYVSVSC